MKITPVKEYTINPNKVIKEKWMTPGLMRCSRKQQNLYKRTLIKTINDKDHEKNKQYRNSLKRVLRLAKEQYYKDKCIEYKIHPSYGKW